MTDPSPAVHYRYLCYVRFEDIPAYLALGWEWDKHEAPLHAPHGNYAVVMEWGRAGPPVEPSCDSAERA